MAAFKCSHCNEEFYINDSSLEYKCDFCKRTLKRDYRLEEKNCQLSTIKDKFDKAKLIGMPYSRLEKTSIMIEYYSNNIIKFINKKKYNFNIRKRWKKIKSRFW